MTFSSPWDLNVKEPSPRIYREFARLLEDDPSDRGYQQVQESAICGGMESAWPALCTSELGKGFSGLERIKQWIGEIDDLQLTVNLRGKLFKKLKNRIELKTVDQKLARIGLPLNYLLLRDMAYKEESPDLEWEIARSIANEWGYEKGGQGPLSLAEAWWMWEHIFHLDEIKLKRIDKPVQIRVVAVSGQEGRIGTLSLSCIDWPEDAPKPAYGFVPHPESFVYCQDEEFRAAFTASHAYLVSQHVWQPDNIVLEWNISLQGSPVASLHGGSIGAALALAAGALLARQQLASSPTPA